MTFKHVNSRQRYFLKQWVNGRRCFFPRDAYPDDTPEEALKKFQRDATELIDSAKNGLFSRYDAIEERRTGYRYIIAVGVGNLTDKGYKYLAES